MRDRIVVTGSRGMLGRAVVSLLALDSGEHQVFPLGRQELDITDDRMVREVLADLRPTVIINCAAYTGVDAAEEEKHEALAVNSRGVRNLALAAAELRCFVCHFSTDYIFNGKKREPYREWEEPWPLNYYGISKQGGEEMLANLWNSYLLIRTSWLYGPGSRNFVDTVRQKLEAGETLRVVNDQFGAPTYVGDLAAAAVALVDLRARGKYHYTNEVPASGISWYDLAREIALVLGYDADRVVQPIATCKIEQAAERPPYSVLGLNKFKELLPMLVRPWQEALRDYLQMT